MPDSRLYYEAHITVNGKAFLNKEDEFTTFSIVAKSFDWRASKFDTDEVDHYDGMWFMSNRNVNSEEIQRGVREMVEHLQRMDYEVIRWKIEDTLFDSKSGDKLEDL